MWFLPFSFEAHYMKNIIIGYFNAAAICHYYAKVLYYKHSWRCFLQ